MAFCRECGAGLAEDAQFCSKCGTAVVAEVPTEPTPAPEQPTPPPPKTPELSQPTPAPPSGGGPTPAQPLGAVAAAPKPKKSGGKKVLKWVGIGIAAFIALIVVVAIVSPADETTTPEPVVQEQPVEQPDQPADSGDAADQPADSGDAAEPEPEPTKTKKPPTAGQSNALESAEQYLEFAAFSRAGLIQQLSSKWGDGYSKADATWAVDHVKVNWNEQAYKAAKQYLDTMPFSRSGLIEQLESGWGEQFTHAQAVYGVDKAGL